MTYCTRCSLATSDSLPGLAVRHRGRGSFLKSAANVAGVDVGDIRALHDQDVGHALVHAYLCALASLR